MKKARRALLLLLVSSSVLLADAQTPLKHIRVIVDTSASLQDNDPAGYVKLSTELFYDLALKELGPNDTFKVVHFPDTKSPSWSGKPTPPKTIDGQFSRTLERNPAAVSDFHRWIKNLPYTSPSTYFSSGIFWALDDLRHSPGKPGDNRVIVLITDGQPDFPREDGEQLKTLAESLRQENVQLFVLAFGPMNQNEDVLNELFGLGTSAGLKGRVFPGAKSDHLLDDMLEIFSESVGFSKERVEHLHDLDPNKIELDVSGGSALQSAIVVASYKRSDQPRFQLDSPQGQSIGTAQTETESAQRDATAVRKQKAMEPDLSYAYQWLVQPAKGLYHFDPKGTMPQEIAILRPVEVQSTIRSFHGYSTDAVMAGKPAPMEVLVSPLNGTSGDPGPNIRICFRLKYLDRNDSRDATCHPPKEQVGVSTGEGRVFTIEPSFINRPDGASSDTQYYQAYIDVEVSQNNTPIYRMDDHPHPVAVYPNVSVGVMPNPAVVKTSNGDELIRGGEAGCVSGIQFVGDASSLPAKSYTLAVRVINANAQGGAWKGARFRFDGKDLSISANRWQMEESETPQELGEAKHSFCVIAGTPSAGVDKDHLVVHFGLWRDGADATEQQLNVVDDLPVTASIAAPNLLQNLTPWIILLLSALLAWFLLLLLRSRSGLAPDLGVTFEPAGGASTAPSAGNRWLASTFLGISQERPVFAVDGDREIGRIKPAADNLFVFRPADGFRVVSVQTEEGTIPLAPEPDGSILLAAGVTYRAGLQGNIHHFRIDYSQQRPPI